MRYVDPTGESPGHAARLGWGIGWRIGGAINDGFDAIGFYPGSVIYDWTHPHDDASDDAEDDSDSGKNCPKDDDDRCDKEWSEARKVCRQLIYEEMEQAAGRKKKRSVTGVTGGFKDVEICARGLVSQQCAGNNVRF